MEIHFIPHSLPTLLRRECRCGGNLDLDISFISAGFSKGWYLKYLATSIAQSPTNRDRCYCKSRGAWLTCLVSSHWIPPLVSPDLVSKDLEGVPFILKAQQSQCWTSKYAVFEKSKGTSHSRRSRAVRVQGSLIPILNIILLLLCIFSS